MRACPPRADPPTHARSPQWFAKPFLADATWRAIFAPQGQLLGEGATIRRANLSRTLALIAADGIDAFYNGSVGASLVQAARAAGGILTEADLANYSVRVAPALAGEYLGRKVYVPGAPTSGPVLLHMLNLAERVALNETADAGLRAHLTVECMKCAPTPSVHRLPVV
jgi:gamma-glutamyltranspeptidase/glutathione hydrolase/leukotriene-C4 hydrolase